MLVEYEELHAKTQQALIVFSTLTSTSVPPSHSPPSMLIERATSIVTMQPRGAPRKPPNRSDAS
jgi:hypothetical protein